jgi:hypothetical protein
MSETKRIMIDGQETDYTISTDGVVINLKTKRELKGTLARNEYRSVQLTINGKAKSLMVHRLVAEAFIPNPNNYPMVNHIDGNGYNNNVNNLEWCQDTKKINIKDNKAEHIDTTNVEWKPLKGFENTYEISSNGVIKNINTKRLSYGAKRNGYIRFSLNGSKYSAHRLVWETFKGEIPEDYVIDHIDGNRSNNDLSNLRCITNSENMINAQKNGHKGQHKVAQYDKNHNLIKEWSSFTTAAKEYGVTYAAISSAAKRHGMSCGFYWEEL